MVRLVKGAYWDTRDQARAGRRARRLSGVHAQGAHRRRLSRVREGDARGAGRDLSAVRDPQRLHDRRDPRRSPATPHYEFQCLHGMGESIYDQVVGRRPSSIAPAASTRRSVRTRRCSRISCAGCSRTAPTRSFVNRIVDPAVDIAELVADPVAQSREDRRRAASAHLPLPAALLSRPEEFAAACDFTDDAVLAALARELERRRRRSRDAAPLLGAHVASGATRARPIVNPADRDDVVGQRQTKRRSRRCRARRRDRRRATATAWSRTPAAERAGCLERAADLPRGANAARSIALAVREAGKTFAKRHGRGARGGGLPAATTRRRRARARRWTTPRRADRLRSRRGIFRWRSSSAKSAAALAAGNPVLAKPAEQTPLHRARPRCALLHRAGVPRAALQLLPGAARPSARRSSPIRAIAGVALHRLDRRRATRSTAQLAARDDDPVLIAETGGQNAMIVDSSALPEQVVADALTSAFDSAGQRCSALRVLCLQDDIADRVLAMLKGAMAELSLGDPRRLDDRCRAGDRRRRAGDARRPRRAACARRGARCSSCRCPRNARSGTFFAPTLIELGVARRLARSRARCSDPCCTCCAGGQRRARRPRRCDQRDRLRPHARHPDADRRDRRSDPRARSAPATSTSIAT